MMMKHRRFSNYTVALFLLAAAGLVFAGLAVQGCGVRQLAKGELMPPEVQFKGLGVQPPTNQGWPLTVVLAVQNPNPMSITVLGYDYEVWAAGQSVAKGTGNQAVTLPARGETTVTVPVVLKLRIYRGSCPASSRIGRSPSTSPGACGSPRPWDSVCLSASMKKSAPRKGWSSSSHFWGNRRIDD